MLFSQIIGKRVLALDSATFVGSVQGLYIEKDTYTVKYIYLANDGMPILPYDELFGKGQILTIKSCESLLDISTIANCIFYSNDLSVYDVDGNLIGETIDLDIKARYNERNFSLSDNTEIKLKAIVSSSQSAIVINPRNRALKPRKRLNIIAKKVVEALPPPQTDNELSDLPYEEIKLSQTPQIKYNPPEPERIINDYSFLLGRRVEREVTDITRSFVIKVGTIINERVIESAKRAGKLVDLTINSIKS